LESNDLLFLAQVLERHLSIYEASVVFS